LRSIYTLLVILCTIESSHYDQSVNDDDENGIQILSEIHLRLTLGASLAEGKGVFN